LSYNAGQSPSPETRVITGERCSLRTVAVFQNEYQGKKGRKCERLEESKEGHEEANNKKNFFYRW
jgi:hypothetical protein